MQITDVRVRRVAKYEETVELEEATVESEEEAEEAEA